MKKSFRGTAFDTDLNLVIAKSKCRIYKGRRVRNKTNKCVIEQFKVKGNSRKIYRNDSRRV